MKKVDHDQRRQEIAESAANIIASEGLEALPTRRLAKQMDCSIGVLSHYYSNKDQIVIAALNWADQRIQERFDQTLLAPQSVEDFEPIIMAAFPLDKQSDMEWRVRLNLTAYSLTHPVLAKSQLKNHQDRNQRLVAAISKLQDDGKLIKTLGAEQLVQNVTDMVTGMAYNLLSLPMDQRLEKVVSVMHYVTELQQK